MKLQHAISIKLVIVLFLIVFFSISLIAHAQTEPPFGESVLPGSAFSGVVPAPDGRLYGLTYDGGTSGQGTLYSVDKTSSLVVVHVNFNGANGAVPYDELTYDTASGKFYGTTSAGGAGNLGTIFSYVPGASSVTTLKNDFDSANYFPSGPLVVSGNYIYGVLRYTNGAVFRIGTNGSGFTILHTFADFGSLPQSVTLGADGWLYGVTSRGGIVCNPNNPITCGTVFRLRPVLPGDPDTQFQTLYQISDRFDAGPQRTVVYGSDGLIYFNNHYRIYRLDPNNPANSFQMIWQETGGTTSMSIIEGTDNRLYAASYDNSQSSFAGSVFSLNRDGTNKVVLRTFSFTAGSTAYGPYGRLYRSPSGTIYGTTEYINQPPPYKGTVFAINPPAPNYVLSGSMDGTASITVDDALDIYQNGVLIYTDGIASSGSRPPIPITANPGDTLQFIVRDTYGVCQSLTPIYLTETVGGNSELAAPGFNNGCGFPPVDNGEIYNYTFTISAGGNSPPALSNVAVSSPITENGAAVLSGNIADANAGDQFTLTVNWGDGSAPQIFNYPAGTTSFSQTHQYLDDDPSGTVSDNYTISLILSDGSLTDTDSAIVTVNNAAPVLSNLSVSPSVFTVGGSTTLSGNVTDVGTLDTHTVTINWGDGSTETLPILPAAVTTFSAAHQYNTSGAFNITVTAADDDAGNTSGGTSVTVTPPPVAPNAPSKLTANAVLPSQINLAWTDNADNETGFLIERCDGNGKCVNFVQIGQTGANTTTFSDVGLTGGTSYNYRVRAFNAVGNSAYSNTDKDRTPRR